MIMKKKPKHLRPKEDFTITSLAWQLDIEKRHCDAGFPAVQGDVLKRRYLQFIRFLYDHGMLSKITEASILNLTDGHQLLNSHVNDQGFYFIQQHHGAWVSRTHKDKGEEAELRFLEKWHKAFSQDFEIPHDQPTDE